MMDSLEDGEMNFRFRENSSLNRALNRIRGIFKRRSAVDEATSWSKLFRVMTHEIMNTVAPIASLSDALSKDDSLDVKAGLETISASSKDLIKFVESYRSMMKLSSLIRKAVMVDELMERVLNLNQTRLKEQNVTITYNAKTPDLLVYIDESQILQVLNNLIKNAVQAEANSIRISAELNSEDRTIISVTNNGKPVPLRQQDEIFVPFYTTKPNGTGIGLSLSRQIMTKHNGNITLVQSDKNTTTFALTFC
jgi:signal transduction histidine kinase